MAKRLTREQQLEKARAIEAKVRRDDFHDGAMYLYTALGAALRRHDYEEASGEAANLAKRLHDFVAETAAQQAPASEGSA